IRDKIIYLYKIYGLTKWVTISYAFFLLILNFKVKIKLTGYLINLKSLSLCKGSGGIIIGMLKYLMYLHKN
ncbi:MAG: hypothetical protein E7J47_10700, partial [Clostridium perfringens]|nr:hypothetical protein [Clostridium perfringens]